MRFMNEYDIDRHCDRWRNHPTLGPAARTLRNLKDVANANSDGWCYWPKPARAAKRLMELLEGDDPRSFYDDRPDVTAAAVRKTYAPIKAFLTRAKLTCELEDPKEADVADYARGLAARSRERNLS